MNYTWEDFNNGVNILQQKLATTSYKPEIIVGITRGGVCLATTLSYRLSTPVYYYDPKKQSSNHLKFILSKNVLVVDEINDSGATLDPFQNIPNVKIAVLVNNITSISKVDFFTQEIDRTTDKRWFVFPWESI